MLNQETFKKLFDALYPRLIAYSYKYVKDKYIAEEIVGECLAILWEKRAGLSHIEDLKSYLYTMVRNASFKSLENNSRVISLKNEHIKYIIDIEHDIIEEEVHGVLLLQALDALPIKCREVFELSCLRGMKYKDIAEDLNISLNTVKSQRSRAIELLKKQLKNNPFLMTFLATL